MPYDSSSSSACIHLTSLPNEVLLSILASLDTPSLCKTQLSCRSLWYICDILIEKIYKCLWCSIVIAPITLGQSITWLTAYQQQHQYEGQQCSWRARARVMHALSYMMDECPKLFINIKTKDRRRRGRSHKLFSFDYRSARIASKRLSFTVTTLLGIHHPTTEYCLNVVGCNDRSWLQVSIELQFNKDAAGNVLVGFCDSITNENLTVDRSRSKVCGKCIAIEPISGHIYTMGHLIASGIPSLLPITTTTNNNNSSSMYYNVTVGVCMSYRTGDIVFLRRLPHWPKGQWLPANRCMLDDYNSGPLAAAASSSAVSKVWYPCICCHALTESSRLNATVLGFEMISSSELWSRFSDSTLLEGIPINTSTTVALDYYPNA